MKAGSRSNASKRVKRRRSHCPPSDQDKRALHGKRFLESRLFELGWDLANEIALLIAPNSDDIRLNYSCIAQEFRGCPPLAIPVSKKGKVLPAWYLLDAQPKDSPPSLSDLLRPEYETDQGALLLVCDLESCIRRHLLAGISNEKRPSALCLRDHSLGASLTWFLCREWVRDSDALGQFLFALLKRWRKIDQPRSVWRRRMALDQKSTDFGHDRVKLLEHLQAIGVIPEKLESDQQQAWLNVIGQDNYRDLRRARPGAPQ